SAEATATSTTRGARVQRVRAATAAESDARTLAFTTSRRQRNRTIARRIVPLSSRSKPGRPRQLGSRSRRRSRHRRSFSDAAKDGLTREIIEHESTHGQPTKTFLKKIRKENGLPPPPPGTAS